MSRYAATLTVRTWQLTNGPILRFLETKYEEIRRGEIALDRMGGSACYLTLVSEDHSFGLAAGCRLWLHDVGRTGLGQRLKV